MKADVALVSCVKLKVDHPAMAKDLYMRSPWFRGARAYAEQNAKRWFIISAAHCLLPPRVRDRTLRRGPEKLRGR